MRNQIRQYGWVVPDLQVAMNNWQKHFSIGPFFVSDKIIIDNAIYRGKAIETNFAGAFAQHGDVMVELVQPLGDEPCIYTEKNWPGDGYLHHVAIFVDDVDAEFARLRSAGNVLAFEGEAGGDRMGYVDTCRSIGCFTEIFPKHGAIDGVFAFIENASRDWDGKDRIRPFPMQMS